MTTRIRVKDVEVRTDADMTAKQVRSLLATVAGIAAAFESDPPEPTVLGFTASVERLPDELAEP